MRKKQKRTLFQNWSNREYTALAGVLVLLAGLAFSLSETDEFQGFVQNSETLIPTGPRCEAIALSEFSEEYNSVSFFVSVEANSADWSGDIVVESDNDSLNYSTGNTIANPLRIGVRGEAVLLPVTITDMQDGDRVMVRVDGEERSCTDTATLELTSDKDYVCEALDIQPDSFEVRQATLGPQSFEIHVDAKAVSGDRDGIDMESLRIWTDGTGTLQSEGQSGTEIEIDVNMSKNFTVEAQYLNGAIGDTIHASLGSYYDGCADTLSFIAVSEEDSDEDGLSDAREAIFGTNPHDRDSDNDSLIDGDEVNLYGTSPTERDTDEDGVNDGKEIDNGTDPLDSDTDDDGLSDGLEADMRTNPLDEDSDNDGLTDGYEFHTLGTQPMNDDTDGGGVEDGWEVLIGTDPLNKRDDKTLTDWFGDDDSDCRHPFRDIEGHWGEDMICRMYQAGILSGRDSQHFEPNDEITRAEFVKVMTLNANLDPNDYDHLKSEFLDVNTDDWYHDYIVTAEREDAIRTREGQNFYPNVDITRGDAVLYSIRLAGRELWGWNKSDIPFSDLTVDDYYTYAFIIAHNTFVDVPEDGRVRLVQGVNGESQATRPITRAEAVAFALRYHLAYFK